MDTPWARYPALFERASGLMFVSETLARFKDLFNRWESERARPGLTSILERWRHEAFHYLQFFGCAYVTRACSDHFALLRRTAPFPFTSQSLAVYLGTAVARPPELLEQAAVLRRASPEGISALDIIEGCAHLFQFLSGKRDLRHGEYLLALARSANPTLYGRLYHKVTLAFGEEALHETLPLGFCALQFAEPRFAINTLLRLTREQFGPVGKDDVTSRIQALRGEAACFHELLGTAADLVGAGSVYHPLLCDPWIFHDAKDWDREIARALSGRSEQTLSAVVNHAPIHLTDAIWFPRSASEAEKRKRETVVETQSLIARLSLRLGGGALEEASHVQH